MLGIENEVCCIISSFTGTLNDFCYTKICRKKNHFRSILMWFYLFKLIEIDIYYCGTLQEFTTEYNENSIHQWFTGTYKNILLLYCLLIIIATSTFFTCGMSFKIIWKLFESVEFIYLSVEFIYKFYRQYIGQCKRSRVHFNSLADTVKEEFSTVLSDFNWTKFKHTALYIYIQTYRPSLQSYSVCRRIWLSVKHWRALLFTCL